MNRLDYSRCAIATVLGGVLTSGCTSLSRPESTAQLPVLVSIVVANDTDQTHEYAVQVQFATDGETPAETVFQTEGTLQARNQQSIDGDWPKVSGQYTVRIAVDGGEWHSQNVTDRLTQNEQICYHQELSIRDDGITFPININADCPD